MSDDDEDFSKVKRRPRKQRDDNNDTDDVAAGPAQDLGKVDLDTLPLDDFLRALERRPQPLGQIGHVGKRGRPPRKEPLPDRLGPPHGLLLFGEPGGQPVAGFEDVLHDWNWPVGRPLASVYRALESLSRSQASYPNEFSPHPAEP